MNWIINLIGILIFFINRFYNRSKKSVPFSTEYWLKDNFQELSTTLLMNLALMIILCQAEKDGSLEILMAKLPEWLQWGGAKGIALALGLGLSWVIYKLFWKKLKDASK